MLTRRRARLKSRESTNEDEVEGTNDLRRRCIPVDCIPVCPTCQDHTDTFTCLKKILTTATILFIALLATYIGWNIMWNDEMIPSGTDPHSDTSKIKPDKTENIDLVVNNILEESLKEMRANIFFLQEQISEQRLTEEMKNEMKDLVRKELVIYDADKTGKPDFALENLGGCILTTRNTKAYKEGTAQFSILGVPIMNFATDPRAIIQANTVPGECWAFAGDKGTAVIQLISYVLITHVSLEHISPMISPLGDILSAPKDFLLKGLKSVDDNKPHEYGNFTYSKDGPPVQTFKVQCPTTIPYNIVEFSVLSNQGNKEFTCIYRVRIHGKPAVMDPKKGT